MVPVLYRLKQLNNGENPLLPNMFKSNKYIFSHWIIYILIDKDWFYYTKDKNLINVKDYKDILPEAEIYVYDIGVGIAFSDMLLKRFQKF